MGIVRPDQSWFGDFSGSPPRELPVLHIRCSEMSGQSLDADVSPIDLVYETWGGVLSLQDKSLIAVIEFAIVALKVQDIYFCGHSNCSAHRSTQNSLSDGVASTYLLMKKLQEDAQRTIDEIARKVKTSPQAHVIWVDDCEKDPPRLRTERQSVSKPRRLEPL